MARTLGSIRRLSSGSPATKQLVCRGPNPRVFLRPRPTAETFSIVNELLAHPDVFILEPGPRHAAILEDLVTKYGVTGPLVTDAVLAALAIENGATLASSDQDFRRFPGLRWINPLAESID